ncbi:MAG: AEC family transporter, partial [Lachnospiraceae bacterium]|nr:AEC family transporter [Lachnospiraceae bacterium]
MNLEDILTNLIFSLNATMPIFFMMVLGFWLKKIKFLDENTTSKINQLVFKIFLPALLFMDLAKEDFAS